jgi:DNA-directed RNA polymerase specialized sigma24 family protein
LLGWTVDDLAHPVGSQRTDAMQAALVAMAQQGNGDAATTLLVQLRPGLIRLARWVAVAADLAWPDAIDEVRAVFFETLYRHPLERRPHSIAANLLLDTRQRVIRSHRRTSQRVGLAAVGPQPPSGSEVGAAGDVDPISRLLVTQVLRAGLDQLPGSDESRALTATIAYRAWVLDQPRSDIARDLGINPEVVTSRLHRLKTNIAQQKSA